MGTETPDAAVEALATALWEAHTSGRLLDPISDHRPIDLDTAYAVQRRLTRLRLDSGDEVVGWKLGYTSDAMRAQMNIAAPNFGPLFSSMVLENGTDVGDRFRQPRVEPEIALRLGADLRAGAAPDEVEAAVQEAFAVLEVVDSSYRGYRFTLPDNTADGSSAAGVVIGPRLDTDDLAGLEVVMELDGVEVGRAFGAAASGHPVKGLQWLLRLLREGEMVRAGQFVITGGLTAAPALDAGHRIEAVFATGARVAVRRS